MCASGNSQNSRSSDTFCSAIEATKANLQNARGAQNFEFVTALVLGCACFPFNRQFLRAMCVSCPGRHTYMKDPCLVLYAVTFPKLGPPIVPASASLPRVYVAHNESKALSAPRLPGTIATRRKQTHRLSKVCLRTAMWLLCNAIMKLNLNKFKYGASRVLLCIPFALCSHLVLFS